MVKIDHTERVSTQTLYAQLFWNKPTKQHTVIGIPIYQTRDRPTSTSNGIIKGVIEYENKIIVFDAHKMEQYTIEYLKYEMIRINNSSFLMAVLYQNEIIIRELGCDKVKTQFTFEGEKILFYRWRASNSAMVVVTNKSVYYCNALDPMPIKSYDICSGNSIVDVHEYIIQPSFTKTQYHALILETEHNVYQFRLYTAKGELCFSQNMQFSCLVCFQESMVYWLEKENIIGLNVLYSYDLTRSMAKNPMTVAFDGNSVPVSMLVIDNGKTMVVTTTDASIIYIDTATGTKIYHIKYSISNDALFKEIRCVGVDLRSNHLLLCASSGDAESSILFDGSLDTCRVIESNDALVQTSHWKCNLNSDRDSTERLVDVKERFAVDVQVLDEIPYFSSTNDRMWLSAIITVIEAVHTSDPVNTLKMENLERNSYGVENFIKCASFVNADAKRSPLSFMITELCDSEFGKHIIVAFKSTPAIVDSLVDSAMHSDYHGGMHAIAKKLPTAPFVQLLNEGYTITLSGHWLSGSIATIFASLLIQLVDNRQKEQIKCVTFGSVPIAVPDFEKSFKFKRQFFNVTLHNDVLAETVAFLENIKIISTLWSVKSDLSSVIKLGKQYVLAAYGFVTTGMFGWMYTTVEAQLTEALKKIPEDIKGVQYYRHIGTQVVLGEHDELLSDGITCFDHMSLQVPSSFATCFASAYRQAIQVLLRGGMQHNVDPLRSKRDMCLLRYSSIQASTLLYISETWTRHNTLLLPDSSYFVSIKQIANSSKVQLSITFRGRNLIFAQKLWVYGYSTEYEAHHLSDDIVKFKFVTHVDYRAYKFYLTLVAFNSVKVAIEPPYSLIKYKNAKKNRVADLPLAELYTLVLVRMLNTKNFTESFKQFSKINEELCDLIVLLENMWSHNIDVAKADVEESWKIVMLYNERKRHHESTETSTGKQTTLISCAHICEDYYNDQITFQAAVEKYYPRMVSIESGISTLDFNGYSQGQGDVYLQRVHQPSEYYVWLVTIAECMGVETDILPNNYYAIEKKICSMFKKVVTTPLIVVRAISDTQWNTLFIRGEIKRVKIEYRNRVLRIIQSIRVNNQMRNLLLRSPCIGAVVDIGCVSKSALSTRIMKDVRDRCGVYCYNMLDLPFVNSDKPFDRDLFVLKLRSIDKLVLTYDFNDGNSITLLKRILKYTKMLYVPYIVCLSIDNMLITQVEMMKQSVLSHLPNENNIIIDITINILKFVTEWTDKNN
jgi:hypothetical protein